MPSVSLLKALRATHLYVGVFIAPAILFFAFSGALQTFGLHETNRDHPNYTPARWEVVLAQIHKKQTSVVPNKRSPVAPKPQPVASPDTAQAEHPHHARPDSKPEPRNPIAPEVSAPAQPAATTPIAPGPSPSEAPKRNPLPLRIFFLIVSIGLFTSTLTGIYMSYKHRRGKLLVTLILIAGIVIPPLLLLT